MITLFVIRPKGFNIGNDAIQQGLNHLLHEAFGRVVNIISLPATSRYESQAQAGLTPRTIHQINQYGHGVIVGGGNLYENGELEVNSNALGRLAVPLLIFSVSKGRIYDRRGRLTERTDGMPIQTVKDLNNKATISLARDITTHRFLQELGFTNTVLGACPTMFLNRSVDSLPRLSRVDKGAVLLSVRTPELMNIPLARRGQVFGDVSRIISFLKAEGHADVRLLCHDHRDIPFAASFSNVEYIYTGDIGRYLALLQECSLNISYRLHATIPCLSYGTPAISISYDERAMSLLETIGYGSWDIKLMETEDVVQDVIARYRALGDLKTLQKDNSSLWEGFYNTQLQALSTFAEAVGNYYQAE